MLLIAKLGLPVDDRFQWNEVLGWSLIRSADGEDWPIR